MDSIDELEEGEIEEISDTESKDSNILQPKTNKNRKPSGDSQRNNNKKCIFSTYFFFVFLLNIPPKQQALYRFVSEIFYKNLCIYCNLRKS